MNRLNMVEGEKLGIKCEKLDRALKDITLEEACAQNQVGCVEMIGEEESSESSDSMNDVGEFEVVDSDDRLRDVLWKDMVYVKNVGERKVYN